MFLLPLLFLVFLYFHLHVMLLVLEKRCGIDVQATQILMSFVLCLILVYWEINHVLLLIFLLIGKSKVLPFPHHASRASQCFELIHIDVWGIALVVSHVHYKYFITFIDNFSLFIWVYFLRTKGEVFSVL